MEHPLQPQGKPRQKSPESPRTKSEDETDFLFSADGDDDDFLFMDDETEDQADPGQNGSREQETELEFTDSFLALDQSPNQTEELSPHHRQEADTELTDQAADDSWALDMLADLEKESRPEPPQHHDEWSLDDDEFRHTPANPFSSDTSRSQQHVQQPTSGDLKSKRDQLETAFATHDLDQLSQHHATPAADLRWPWLLTSGLLVLLLIGQFAWWERESLSQKPPLRGVYIEACNLIGCTLPEPTPDAGSIRALSSVLRPLPDGQMRLDAVFVNRSERQAPYPVLQLEIQDFQGTVTADGLFAPEDYVGGEVQPGDMMPPGRPVSISINLNRPVEELNNFRLTFHY